MITTLLRIGMYYECIFYQQINFFVYYYRSDFIAENIQLNAIMQK